MATAVDYSYDRISDSNNADLDHSTIQATNATRPGMVVCSSSLFARRHCGKFCSGDSNHDLALARNALVFESYLNSAAATAVCCDMDGAAKPFRVDIPSVCDHRLCLSPRS